MIRPPPNTMFRCFILKSSVKLSLKFLFIFPFYHHHHQQGLCHKFLFLNPPGTLTKSIVRTQKVLLMPIKKTFYALKKVISMSQ